MSSNQGALSPPGIEPPGGQQGEIPVDIAESFEEPFPDDYRVQKVEAVIYGQGNYFCIPTDLKYKNGRHDKAAMLECTAYAPNGQPPEEGGGIEFRVNGGVVFTGPVYNSFKDTGDKLVQFEAYDGVKRLYGTEFGKKYGTAQPDKVALDIFKKAGVKVTEENIVYEAPGRTGLKAPDQRGETFEVPIDQNFSGNCVKAIKAVASKSDALWYFDRYNRAFFTNNIQNRKHDVTGVLDHSAGEQSIPYTKVVIKGEKKTDNGLPQNGVVKGVAGEGDNVFRERFNSIHKQSVAKLTAQKILKDFQRKRASGKVELVGNPVVRPFDAIELPEKYGNETYSVAGISHNISASDGFTTTVNVNSLIDAEDPTSNPEE